MPRRNRNPGSGKPPFNGPARGGPAAGEGRGGPAQGEGMGLGWGGDAKPLRPGFDELPPEYAQMISALARDPKHQEAKEAARKLALTTWVQVAALGENESARVVAGDKLGKVGGLIVDETVLRHANAAGDGDMTVKHKADDALRSAIDIVGQLEAVRRSGDSGADQVAGVGPAETGSA